MMRREYPSRPMVGIGAVIIHNGKILLIKRGSEPGKGKWSIPGGLVELGETIAETVVREAKEETNLDVEAYKLVDVVDNIMKDENGKIQYHYVVIDFLTKLKNADTSRLKPAQDAADAKWTPLEEVEQRDLTKTFRAFFERNRDALKSFSFCR